MIYYILLRIVLFKTLQKGPTRMNAGCLLCCQRLFKFDSLVISDRVEIIINYLY